MSVAESAAETIRKSMGIHDQDTPNFVHVLRLRVSKTTTLTLLFAFKH